MLSLFTKLNYITKKNIEKDICSSTCFQRYLIVVIIVLDDTNETSKPKNCYKKKGRTFAPSDILRSSDKSYKITLMGVLSFKKTMNRFFN